VRRARSGSAARSGYWGKHRRSGSAGDGTSPWLSATPYNSAVTLFVTDRMSCRVPGCELDETQRVTPGEVLAGPVVLEHGSATANRHDGMQTAGLASEEQLVEVVA
jgi:hypothetical protein